MTLDYRFTPDLTFGVECNPAAGELVPRGNLYLAKETKRSPAVILGTSSDRIGTREGNQAYFGTVAKRIAGTPLAPYLSVNYSGQDRKLNLPFGASVELHPNWSLLPMYDGQRSHLLLNYRARDYGASLIWVWYERFGVSFSTGI